MGTITYDKTQDYLIIPKAQPFKFVKQVNGVESWFKDSISALEKQTDYKQIWEIKDSMTFQIQVKFSALKPTVLPLIPVVVDLIDCNENILIEFKHIIFATIDGWSYLHFHCNFEYLGSPVFPEGQYNIRMRFTLKDDDVDVFYSEPICFKREHKNSVLLEYRHSVNDYGMIWQPLFIQYASQIAAGTKDPESIKSPAPLYRMRLKGGLWSKDESPASEDVGYIDQTRSRKMLSSQPFNIYNFTFGDNRGLPNYIIDKVNRIFSCEFVKIRREFYTKNDGASVQQVWSEQRYPLMAWNLELCPYENKYIDKYRAILKKTGIGNMVIGAGYTVAKDAVVIDDFVPVFDLQSAILYWDILNGEVI